MKINRNSKKYIQLMFLLLSALLLGSCQNNEDNTCSGVVETAGEPDLTAAASFDSATVVQNGTVNVSVPVDGETSEGTVFLLPVGSQTVAGAVATVPFVTLNANVAETVTFPIVLTAAIPQTVGFYYPMVVLCDTAVATCTKGAGYVEDISGLLADTGNYVRGTANGGTVDLSSLIDSCVPITTVEVQ